ncbi:MAG: GC-type dockerin domain-anchored protein [Planctomycetota bacterium]
MTRRLMTAGLVLALSGGVCSAQNLLTNPGFEDVLSDGNFGDGWGTFGNVGFDDFFPASTPGHAVLFGDTIGNSGNLFQLGIGATPGTEYRFRTQVSFELFWAAETTIGLEFYEGDDATLITSVEREINESVDSGYGFVEVTAVAPEGAVFVRPIISFDNVEFDGTLQAGTVDDAELVELSDASNRTINPAFLDTNGDMTTGDNWGTFGNVALDLDFFGSGNPGHATLFGDNLGNEGFLFQTGLAGTEGVTYEVAADIQTETNWDADMFFGIEFYDATDGNKLSEVIEQIAPAPGTGYSRFTVSATAPAGTVFVRPIVFFNNVQTQGVSRASTVDNFILTVEDGFENFNPGMIDQYGTGPGSAWATFGAAALDLDFFNSGDPGHATLFADMVDNFGGVFQTSVPAIPGETYGLLADLSVEENFDASYRFGLEFYEADDATKISEVIVPVTATPGAGYFEQGVEAVAPAGAAFVRPIALFDSVVTGGTGTAATVDNMRVILGGLPSSPCVPDITTDGANPGDPDFLVPDGAVTVSDLSTFVEQWLASSLTIADITTDGANPGDADFLVPDGAVTVSDLSTFVEQWLAGCP